MLMYCVCWREKKPEKVVFTTDLSRWDYTCQGRPPSCWDNFGEVLCIRGSQTTWPTSWTWIGAQSFGWVYHLSRFCLLWYFNRLSGCQGCSAVFLSIAGWESEKRYTTSGEEAYMYPEAVQLACVHSCAFRIILTCFQPSLQLLVRKKRIKFTYNTIQALVENVRSTFCML